MQLSGCAIPLHVLVVVVLLVGCGERTAPSATQDAPPVAVDSLQTDSVTLTLHRAYEFPGKAYFEPRAGTKLIAIEASIEGGGPWFDADDIELSGDGRNYGSFPDVTALNADWAPVDPMLAGTNIRLVYQVPEECCQSVNLIFSGQKLLAQEAVVSR